MEMGRIQQPLRKNPTVRTYKEKNILKEKIPQQADLISITYYTDPLCCWSWIFEAEWKKLLTHFKNEITWYYCMGGLLPGWNNYHDVINCISKPLQMGPMWLHASQLSGLNIRHDIWAKDPPASSYPACIAVKSAQLQSASAGEKYLFLLRRACMQNGENIAKPDILLKIAAELANDRSCDFDTALFIKNLFGIEGREAFKKDVQEIKYRGINRFPSLLIRNANYAKLITGYQTLETITPVLADLITPSHHTN
jgi:putative protein-disulfide isomerase